MDDKNAPFVDRNGAPTSTVNEQVCNLWSLEEMVYLSKLRGEDLRHAGRIRRRFVTQFTRSCGMRKHSVTGLGCGDRTTWTQGENSTLMTSSIMRTTSRAWPR